MLVTRHYVITHRHLPAGRAIRISRQGALYLVGVVDIQQRCTWEPERFDTYSAAHTRLETLVARYGSLCDPA